MESQFRWGKINEGKGQLFPIENYPKVAKGSIVELQVSSTTQRLKKRELRSGGQVLVPGSGKSQESVMHVHEVILCTNRSFSDPPGKPKPWEVQVSALGVRHAEELHGAAGHVRQPPGCPPPG